MNNLARLSSLALTIALASITASAAPFSNGSFETGSPTGGSPLGSPDNSTIPSWSISGTSGTIEFNSNGDNGQNAQAGTQFISFGHNTTTGGMLSQTFDTVIGTVYTVNYFVSRIQSGISAQAMSVTALNSSNVILNLVATNIPATNNVWVAGTTLTFMANSTSTTLRFTDITAPGGGGDSNWALDNVTISAPTAPAGAPDTGSTISLLALTTVALTTAGRFARHSTRV